MLFCHCTEVEWGTIAVRNDFISYDCHTGEVYGLHETSVPVANRNRDVEAILSSTTLPAVPGILRERIERSSLEAIWRDYDEIQNKAKGCSDPVAGEKQMT